MAKITLANYATGSKWVPLGCLNILAALRKEGHQVRFVDLQLIEFVRLHKSNILIDDSKYLLISTISMMLPWLFQTTKMIRDIDPGKKIILGGPGVSPISEEILSRINSIDYIIEGEGEIAIIELIRALEKKHDQYHNFKNIHNLVYRENNQIIKNKRITQGGYNLSHSSDYTDINSTDYDVISSIITSYGCPYDCGFCYNQNMWGGKVILKPVEQIFNEVDHVLKRYKLNHIVFLDDLFFISKKRCNDFYDLYNLGNYKFKYVILGARVDSLDENILIKLKRTNCMSLSFGLESASNGILNKINKEFTIEKALMTINLARKYISDISISFIIGFPFESIAEFNDTIKLATALYKESFHVILNFLRPQIGTQIYLEYKNELFLSDFHQVIKPFNIDNEIKEIIRENIVLYNWYYTYKSPALEEKIKTYSNLNIKYTPINQRIGRMGV